MREPWGSGHREEQFRRQLFVSDDMAETGLSSGGTFVAEDFGRAGREGFEEIREAARLASRTVVDAFEDWIKGSLHAEDALKSFARQLSEIGLQKFVLNPLVLSTCRRNTLS